MILSFDRVDRSSSRETGGSGFEFAISKALVGTRGGTISAESSGRNQGSRFRIWLPSAATHSQTNSSVGQ